MTNRVPPLHPASPPPFSKLSFYEDDVDENDDFANYTIATPDLEEKFHRDTPESTENAEGGIDGNILSPSPTVGTPVIEDVPTNSHSKDLRTLAECDTSNNGSKYETLAENEILRCTNVDGSSMITDDNALLNSNNFSDVLLLENGGKSDHFDVDDNVENDIKVRISEKNVASDDIVLENFSDALNIGQTEESIPPETREKNDSLIESSDDSSAVINEAAFIVDENGSDVEDDIFDDGFQEFSNYKTDSAEEVINAPVATFIPFEETDQLKTKRDCADDQLLSTVSKQVVDASYQVFELHTETKLVTLDDSQISETHLNTESSIKCDEHVELMDENDDFDDFVSSPVYKTHSTQQLVLDIGTNSTEDSEFLTLSTKDHSSTTYATDCWSEIFEYSGEDPIEVNLNTLEGKLNGSSIWCQMKNIETSPALKFNWNESETKKLLLATLGVDLRNILFGPRWNSEVPRFASNLKFSPLVPQKASSEDNFELRPSDDPIQCMNNETVSQISSGVQDAHFDWTGSGLTNPLDAHSHSTLLDLELLANFDIHSPYYKEKRKSDKITKVTTAMVSQLEYDLPAEIENSTTNRGLTTEATRILNSLPDLIVMEKQYIVFPIR